MSEDLPTCSNCGREILLGGLSITLEVGSVRNDQLRSGEYTTDGEAPQCLCSKRCLLAKLPSLLPRPS